MQWLIKIKIEFFTEIEKNKPKFSRNQKKSQITKSILRKEKSLVVVYFLISNYYKVTEQIVSDLSCLDLGFFKFMI